MEYSRRDIATLAGLGLVGVASQALAQRTETAPFDNSRMVANPECMVRRLDASEK